MFLLESFHQLLAGMIERNQKYRHFIRNKKKNFKEKESNIEKKKDGKRRV